MKPKFLLDENLSKTIKFAVLLINDRSEAKEWLNVVDWIPF